MKNEIAKKVLLGLSALTGVVIADGLYKVATDAIEKKKAADEEDREENNSFNEEN